MFLFIILLLTFSIHAMESESKEMDLETRKRNFLTFQSMHQQDLLISTDLMNQNFLAYTKISKTLIKQTILTQAIYRLKTLTAVKPLVDQGVDVNETGSIIGITRSRIVEQETIVPNCGTVIYAKEKPREDCSPLWLAMRYAPEIVPLLLEKKAELNEKEKKYAVWWELYDLKRSACDTSLDVLFLQQEITKNIQLLIHNGACLNKILHSATPIDLLYDNLGFNADEKLGFKEDRFVPLLVLLLRGGAQKKNRYYSKKQQPKFYTLIEQIPAIQESYQKKQESYLGQLPKDLQDKLIHFVVERINIENKAS